MKFSRQKMQHLKWLRRKELIRINCFIMVAILLMVLLFMGFPIVSNAESVYTYDDTVMSHLNFSDADLLISRNVTIPDGYSNGLFDNDNYYVYFDDDLSNGSFIWDSRIDDYSFTVNDNSLHISDCPTYSIYFTDDSHISLEFYGVGNCCYKYFCENAQSNGLIRMFYSYPNGYNENSNAWLFPDDNYVVRCLFTKSSDGNFYLNSSNPFRFYNNTFTSNNRYINGIYCAYGTYTSNLIVTNVPTYTCSIEPYLKRASYIPDGDTVRTTDWLNVDGVQINPNYNDSSGGVNSSSVLDNDYIGTSNFIFGNGSAINNFDLKIGVDFNEDQMRNISDYSYQLDCNLKATYNLAKHLGSNAETQLLSSYGLSFGSGDALVVNQDFNFTINDNFSSNYFSIPSSVFNDGLVQSGYTAIPLVNYIWQYCPASTLTNKVEAFYDSISQATIGPFSLPGYSETNYFSNCNIKYDFVMNIYNKDGDQINSLPLALSYNPMTGEQNMYSNGGGVPHDQVKNIVDTHNENKQPTDMDYLPPSNYNPTLTPSNNNNDNSSNSNSSSYGGSVSVVNNPSITIQQGNKYPEKGVMQSFVRIINNDKNNTVNDIDTLIGGSSYIQLMNNALVAVPDQVWSIWITALKAILGIAVSAFFLKILINWAT